MPKLLDYRIVDGEGGSKASIRVHQVEGKS